MARRETRVADHLRTFGQITTITGQRVFDVDYRAAGWNAAPVDVLDVDGLILPTLVVDDTGSGVPIFGLSEAREPRIEVWAFGNRTRHGVDAVDDLMRMVAAALEGWQDPASRETYHEVDRQGKQFVEDGTLDRLFFRVAGIPKRLELT